MNSSDEGRAQEYTYDASVRIYLMELLLYLTVFLKVVYCKSTLAIFPSRQSVFPITQNIPYLLQYTENKLFPYLPQGLYRETLPVVPQGVYRLIVNEIYKGIFFITILKNDILLVLRLNSGFTVKYRPLPLGVPSGFALGNSLRRRAIFDRIS